MSTPTPTTRPPLPVGVSTADTTSVGRLRNQVAGRAANAVLRLATPQYRAFIANTLRYGLDAAAEAVEPDPPSPLSVPCRDCGAEANHACRDEIPGAIGYHNSRYDDAGWPAEDDDPETGRG